MQQEEKLKYLKPDCRVTLPGKEPHGGQHASRPDSGVWTPTGISPVDYAITADQMATSILVDLPAGMVRKSISHYDAQAV